MVYPHTYRTEHSETHTTNSVYGEYYSQAISKKIKIQPDLQKLIKYMDSRRENFLQAMAKAVEIKSVSGDLQHRKDLQKMIDFTQKWFFEHELAYEPFNIGYYEIDGQKVRLPTIILASLGNDPKKRTICVYLHLDVKKPNVEKWKTDPWKVTVEGNHIYGCGMAQGKANLMHWFHLIEAFKYSKVEFPVNLKFIIESMYHHDSLGLSEFLPLRKHDFFVNIDSVLVCDGEWLGEKHPCIIYGTVGLLHFDLYIEKVAESKTDPKQDMETIFKEVVDEKEQILIPHFDEIVLQITPEEEKMYEEIHDFSVENVRDTLPPFKHNWDKVKLLMHYWRLPSIWIGETEECTCPNKDSNIVKRHFIEKIVPHQIISKAISHTTKHIGNVMKKHKIENKVKCECTSSTRYWFENAAHRIYQAGRRATIQIYKEDPSMIREDRSRPLLSILDQVLETHILLMPMVPRGSNAGGDNENINKRIFFEITKLLGAFVFQVAK